MVLERSIDSDFVFLEAMYRQGFIRKQCELGAGWPPRAWGPRGEALLTQPAVGARLGNGCYTDEGCP